MFTLTILRGASAPEGTPGKLVSSAGFTCDTQELQWANNKRGISCIMPDTYDACLWFSPMLKRMVVRLEDKHGRHDCLIHNGNWAGEGEGEITQIHGCTEVGHGFGDIKRPDGVMQHGILNSGNTLNMLIEHIISQVGQNGHFNVTYAWDTGCEPEDMTDLNEEKA